MFYHNLSETLKTRHAAARAAAAAAAGAAQRDNII
jgi:hypothetical protein